MVEVFKTNIQNWEQARAVLARIHKHFSGYRVNFDLEDRDKILRVESYSDLVNAEPIIDIVNSFGFEAEVLPDELPLIEPIFTVFGSYPFPGSLIN